jgi:hypothetical protein
MNEDYIQEERAKVIRQSDIINKVVKWLENEVYEGAEIVKAKHNRDEEVTSDGTDDIIYGRAECAESLLNQIKKWNEE